MPAPLARSRASPWAANAPAPEPEWLSTTAPSASESPIWTAAPATIAAMSPRSAASTAATSGTGAATSIGVWYGRMPGNEAGIWSYTSSVTVNGR